MDEGVRIKAEDRGSGTVHGTYDNIDVKSFVRHKQMAACASSSTPPATRRATPRLSTGSHGLMTGAWADSFERPCSAGFVKTADPSTNNQIGV